MKLLAYRQYLFVFEILMWFSVSTSDSNCAGSDTSGPESSNSGNETSQMIATYEYAKRELAKLDPRQLLISPAASTRPKNYRLESTVFTVIPNKVYSYSNSNRYPVTSDHVDCSAVKVPDFLKRVKVICLRVMELQPAAYKNCHKHHHHHPRDARGVVKWVPGVRRVVIACQCSYVVY